MKKVEVKLQRDPEGGWIASSSEVPGFFAVGESRKEALRHAKEGIALFLGVEEKDITLEVTEESEPPPPLPSMN